MNEPGSKSRVSNSDLAILCYIFKEHLVGLQYTDREKKKVYYGLAWDECAPKQAGAESSPEQGLHIYNR